MLCYFRGGGVVVAESKTPAKRAIQIEKRRLRNAMQKSKLKSALKKHQCLMFF